ncbi:MAG: hypothetical protein MZU84_04760 [Sphingobacterium sp.]|nr:hypothetical protein [Sphingobacterium sp.]
MQHGLITWGQTARESYTIHLDLVTQAEAIAGSPRAARRHGHRVGRRPSRRPGTAWPRWGPFCAGARAPDATDADRAWDRVVLQPIVTDGVLRAARARRAPGSALVTPPLTTDHLIRTRSLPLWIDAPGLGRRGPACARSSAPRSRRIGRRLRSIRRAPPAPRCPDGLGEFDPTPRVVLVPGPRRDLRRPERPRSGRSPGHHGPDARR